jgi:hypothetical protein
MRCNMCNCRFPYAEVYDFQHHCWYYVCKKCYMDDRQNKINSHGYYELTRLERLSATFGLTFLKWKIQKLIWNISYKFSKDNKCDIRGLTDEEFEEYFNK